MNAGVLSGIKVLDFSRLFAGPAATQILGDLGADVIKVEDPGYGDDARTLGVRDTEASNGFSPSFIAFNRNKRSIVLDLRTPAGRAVALRLASACDVVIHNFRPRVMEQWNLAYRDICAVNPSVVYGHFSAYGGAGPLAEVGANDVAMQAHSGLISVTGEPDRDPVRCGAAVVDLHGGAMLVSGILAALLHRERTGKGQEVGSSLLMSSAHLMSYFYTEYWLDGTVRAPLGTANHLSVPNQAFPSADGAVVIIAYSDDMWRRCLSALDALHLDRPEYRTGAGRRQHSRRLIEEFSAVTASMTSTEIVERLIGVRVIVAKVNSVGEAADDAQLEAAGGVTTFASGAAQLKSISTPFSLTLTPPETVLPPPALGEQTADILRDFGIGDDEVRAFRGEGAFGPA